MKIPACNKNCKTEVNGTLVGGTRVSSPSERYVLSLAPLNMYYIILLRMQGVIISVCGTRRSEHAHNVSKWRLTMSLATECTEKVRSECSKLR